MSQQIPPIDRASARRFGADAIDGYRARRSGQGCISLEVLAVVVTAAILTHFATDLSTPTVIGLAILAFIAGNILFMLRSEERRAGKREEERGRRCTGK